MPTGSALKLAYDRGLDLIEVSPKAQPPVCKLMNYGQYMYQLARAQAKQKVKQKKIELKGVRLSFKMGEYDLTVRQKQTEKFLAAGNKVKVELILRGREQAHKDLAFQKMRNFVTSLGEKIIIEQAVTTKGNCLSTIIARKITTR